MWLIQQPRVEAKRGWLPGDEDRQSRCQVSAVCRSRWYHIMIRPRKPLWPESSLATKRNMDVENSRMLTDSQRNLSSTNKLGNQIGNHSPACLLILRLYILLVPQLFLCGSYRLPIGECVPPAFMDPGSKEDRWDMVRCFVEQQDVNWTGLVHWAPHQEQHT